MANCFIHPRQHAAHSCVECGRDICRSCTTLIEGEAVCELCHERYVVHQPEPEEVAARETVPWQRIHELGPITAFWATSTEMVLRPQSFFQRMGTGAPWGAAVLFAVICIMLIWYPVQFIHLTILFPLFLDVLSQQSGIDADLSERISSAQARYASITEFDIIVMPIQYFIVYLLIGSIVQQLFIMVFRGRGGLADTFQVRCYAMVVQCLVVIPVFGFFLAELAHMLLCAVGFREVQQLTYAQAFLVSAIPVLITMVLMPMVV